MASVALCAPHGGAVRPDWYRAILEMQNATPQHQFMHVDVDSMIVGKARNMCVETAMSMKADVIWFIDDDVIVPSNAGVLVDQALALGVVSGLYFSRRFPFTPQIYEKASEEEGIGMYWPLFDWDKGVTRVAAVGAGCLAVATGVFTELKKQLKPPVFDESHWWTMSAERLSPWFEFLDRKGEDMYFCERCSDIGQQVFCNTDIECAHIGDLPITSNQFLQLRDAGMIHRAGVAAPGQPEVLE